MKTLYSLLATAVACGFASAQTTATTTPVGYITHTLVGNTAANSAGADTFISPSLVNPTLYAGQTTVDPSGLTTLTFSGGVPTGLVGVHVIEISTGASEGWWSQVVSTTDTSIVVGDALPAGLGANVQISLRKLPTLGSWIGANLLPSLSVIDGVNTEPPDEVQIFDPILQQASSAVYVTTGAGVPADGWYDFVTQADLTNTPIYPGDAVKFKRFASSEVTFVSTGEVKISKTQIDLQPGYNWLGQPLATGGTLGSMNFASQLNMEDGNEATNPPADFLDFLYGDQSTSSFVALDPVLGAGNIMVNFVTQEDATNTPVIKEGTGFIINRSLGAAQSTITIPAQVVAP